MGEELWYYELLMDQVGPVPRSQLESLIDDGILATSDRIRNAASTDWISVADLADKQPSDELDINSFTFASSTDLAEPELEIDQVNLVGDSDLPQATPVSKPTAALEPVTTEPTYFVRSLGHELGPMSLAEVIEMARSGSLSLVDEIRIDDFDWKSVASVSQISAEIATDASGNSSQAGSQTMRRIGATAPPPEVSQSTERSEVAAASPVRTKKKKRKSKEDRLLNEIFEEVFKEDGALNEERLAPNTAPTPVASPPVGQPGHTPSVGAVPPFQNTQAPVAQAPRFVPPKKKRSSSSFELPDPKVLGGIGGGLLVLILLIGGITGTIPIFGMSVDRDEFLSKVIREYPAAYEGEKEGWNAFKSKYFETSRELVQQIRNDPEAGRMKDAAGHAYHLLAISWDFKEKIPDTFEKLKKSYFGG